jgi:mono/diheme cytochrome c family protein
LLFPLTVHADNVVNPVKLYEQHCLRCHGESGDGKGPAYTNLRPWPRDFQKGAFKFRSTPLGTLPTVEDLERVIAKGILRSSMPPFETFLTAKEIRALAEYTFLLATRSGKVKGEPVALNHFEKKAEDIEKGKKEYRELGCVSCHGDDGRGLGPAAATARDADGWWLQPIDLTDPLAYGGGADASTIFKHLVTGLDVSTMPHYGDLVAHKKLWQVARYLESIQVAGDKRELISPEQWRQSLPPEVRGEYLTRAMACSLCHTHYRRDGSYRAKFYLAGGVRFYIPGYGTLYMRNLTGDRDTGLGNWTQGQIVQAIKQGKAPDRQLDALGMPWPFFNHLTDEDAQAIAAYLKTLKPIHNPIPDRKMDPFWKRIYHRMKQFFGLEHGRLEYWPGNAGEA